jgi:hypothetical protein
MYIKLFDIHTYKDFIDLMVVSTDYFVVFSNLSSIPTIIYFQYYQKYYYSIQVLLVSLFSFLHHLNTSKLYIIYDNGLFTLLDGLYSYLSIYVFSVYLFLSNHNELKLELTLMQTILLSLTYMNIGSVIVLPVTVLLILFITGIHYTKINKFSFKNKYIYITLLMCTADIMCYFIAIHTEYNYFHSFHHLFSFTIPIFVDKCVTYIPPNQATD